MKTIIKAQYVEHLINLEKSLKAVTKKLHTKPKHYPTAIKIEAEVIVEALFLMESHLALTKAFIAAMKMDKAHLWGRMLCDQLTIEQRHQVKANLVDLWPELADDTEEV